MAVGAVGVLFDRGTAERASHAFVVAEKSTSDPWIPLETDDGKCHGADFSERKTPGAEILEKHQLQPADIVALWFATAESKVSEIEACDRGGLDPAERVFCVGAVVEKVHGAGLVEGADQGPGLGILATAFSPLEAAASP